MFVIRKNLIRQSIGVLLLCILFTFFYKIYIHRITAFGCFDDCNNFMGGYFLLHKKALFSQIFFNHAPGMVYLSALIQYITHPINLYELILRHRQFVIGFGFVMDVLLFLRFGYKILGWAILYELTKFYLFGDRFLAEGIIVYVVIYLAAFVWEKIQKKNLSLLDILFSAVGTWFVVVMREPYIPLALVLFVMILWNKKQIKEKMISLCLFLILLGVVIFYHNVQALIFNVFTVNAVVNIPGETAKSNIFGSGILQVFFYPFYVFFEGSWGYFRYLLIGLDTLFLVQIGYYLWQRKWKEVLFIFLILGIANLRVVAPGSEFYDAFHMLIWYGLFLFFSMELLWKMRISNKKVALLLGVGYVVIVGNIVFSHQSFLHDRVNEHDEYIINFGHYLQVGNVVADLSTPKDTLFLDGNDDSIYWVAHRYSTYQYSWYTSLMPAFAVYTNARMKMFATTPPDFYYGSCLVGAGVNKTLPTALQGDYVRLLENNKPSCLWVKKTKLGQITTSEWQKAKQELYGL